MNTVLLLLFFSCAAVAADVEVTFSSNPPLAGLFYGGLADLGAAKLIGLMGLNQTAFRYALAKGEDCVKLPSLTAFWMSGASLTLEGFGLCRKNGKKQSYVFVRPDQVPGIETDQAFVAQARALQAEANRKRRNADIGSALQSFGQALQNNQRRVHCVSNGITTNCYSY